MEYKDNFPFELIGDLEDYERFGEAFSVPVPVRRFAGGRILWVNHRWFELYGVDMRSVSTRCEIDNWLLETFCFEAVREGDADRQKFLADRYGANGGSAHGGSGRCAYIGRFNVKGIGPTPLVPHGLTNHSDGTLQLVDAIREAIYSELCAQETVCGAVATIAIIAKDCEGTLQPESNCFCIRPNFLRPAHFERSLVFGTAGTKESDQYQDALRCAAVRSALHETGPGVAEIARVNAAQIGSMDAMRMVQGRFTSANVSVSGEVADFGSFRQFDNWRYVRLIASDADVFGKDLTLLKKAVRNWAKVLGGATFRNHNVDDFVESGHAAGFRWVVENLCSGRASQKVIDQIFGLFYKVFQGNISQSGGQFGKWPFAETKLGDASRRFDSIAELLAGEGVNPHDAVSIIARLELWTLRRGDISYSNLSRLISELFLRAVRSGLREDVSHFIERAVSANRRLIPDLPLPHVPVGHTFFDGRFALYFWDIRKESMRVAIWNRAADGIAFRQNPYLSDCKWSDLFGIQKFGSVENPIQIPACDVIYNIELVKQVSHDQCIH